VKLQVRLVLPPLFSPNSSQDCGIARRCKLFRGTEFERGALVQEDLLLVPPMERTSGATWPRYFRLFQLGPMIGGGPRPLSCGLHSTFGHVSGGWLRIVLK